MVINAAAGSCWKLQVVAVYGVGKYVRKPALVHDTGIAASQAVYDFGNYDYKPALVSGVAAPLAFKPVVSNE